MANDPLQDASAHRRPALSAVEVLLDSQERAAKERQGQTDAFAGIVKVQTEAFERSLQGLRRSIIMMGAAQVGGLGTLVAILLYAVLSLKGLDITQIADAVRATPVVPSIPEDL